MLRSCLITFAILILSSSCARQNNSLIKSNFSFVPFEERLYDLMNDNRYDDAFALLDSLEKTNDSIGFDLSLWRGRLYLETEQYDSAMAVWEEGHSEGYFYRLHPNIPDYKPLAQDVRFDSLVSVDKNLRDSANEKSSMQIKVSTPCNYSADRKYPLFLVLHGGGSSIERAESNWYSKMMGREYITVFVQNFRHYDSKHFGWRSSDDREREEFKKVYDELIKNYPIDSNHVIVGGISAGGSAALDFVLNEIIPSRGFIGVCTGKPGEFIPEKIAKLGNRVKGYMVSGEKDFYLERQKEMTAVFDSIGFAYEYHIIDSLGHEYPDNFPDWIDSALEYLD